MLCKVYWFLLCLDERPFCADELNTLQRLPRHFGQKFTGVTLPAKSLTTCIFIKNDLNSSSLTA